MLILKKHKKCAAVIKLKMTCFIMIQSQGALKKYSQNTIKKNSGGS